jgi:hypothetical protein
VQDNVQPHLVCRQKILLSKKNLDLRRGFIRKDGLLQQQGKNYCNREREQHGVLSNHEICPSQSLKERVSFYSEE